MLVLHVGGAASYGIFVQVHLTIIITPLDVATDESPTRSSKGTSPVVFVVLAVATVLVAILV